MPIAAFVNRSAAKCELNQALWSASFPWPKRLADAKFDRTLTSAKSRQTALAASPELSTFDKQRREVFQRAKAIFVCTNGAETPKLLLMSKSKRFPDGLANSSGLVGKYLMWDNGAEVQGLFEHPLNEHKSIQVTRLIHDHYAPIPRVASMAAARLTPASISCPPALLCMVCLPIRPKWGTEYKQLFTTYFNRTMTLLSHTSSLAQTKNTVTLDPDMKDDWGLPALRITSDYHPDDLATIKWIQSKQIEILQAAGAQKIWCQSVEMVDNMPSRHLMGTCRMGHDPATSVVNAIQPNA